MIQLSVGERRFENLKFQLGKKAVPERIELKHIKPHWDAQLAAQPLNGLVFVKQPELVFIHIQLSRGSLFGDRAFAAVACDVFSALAKGIYGQAAVVVAHSAVCHLDLVNKIL